MPLKNSSYTTTGLPRTNNLKKIVIGILIFVTTHLILSDWDNFKRGLSGKPPIEKMNGDQSE